MANAVCGAVLRHLRDLFGRGATVDIADGQLLARYAETRDGTAFECLVARHGPMVLATCRAVLKNEHDVEDAFQATFFVLAKKARSVRASAALGGWLHRVAYRAAIQSSLETRRRRQREVEVRTMAMPDAHQHTSEPDVQPILHEEIDCLPDNHRLPVVLCDLEGLSYEAAAERLSWTVPKLRTRLAKARERLRGRLVRRGVSAAIAAAVSIPTTASAAVSASLLKATVASATGGAISANAVLLSQMLIRGMLMTRFKALATTVLSLAVIVSAGYVALGARPPSQKPAIDSPKPANAADKPSARTPPASEGLLEVHGRVVSPDGKPVAGATVESGAMDPTAKSADATSGSDGRFTIRVTRKILGAEVRDSLAMFPWLTATSPDFGAGENEGASRGDPHADQTIRLIPNGPPIEGRILDLEGRPVAGARVATQTLWFNGKGDLASWINKIRGGAVVGIWRDLEQMQVKIATTTRADGRFRLTGVGQDRVADLLVSGANIATTQMFVLCREEPEIRTVDKGGLAPEPFIVHAPRFELAVAPTRPIEGVARDRVSGKPIPDLTIKGMVFDERSFLFPPGIEAKTDALGRYRLTGLPTGPAYRLNITPSPGQAFLTTTLKAPAASLTIEPLKFDFTLKPGVIIRGRITEKTTGRPVRPGEGTVYAYVFEDNPHSGDYPVSGYPTQTNVDADGRFEIATVPGRGVLAVRLDDASYRGASGAAKMKGYDSQMNALRTRPSYVPLSGYHIIAEVNSEPNAAPKTLDLLADPGRSVKLHIVDVNGEPIGGTEVKGIGDLYRTGPHPQASADFEVHALDPSDPRRVVVTHQKRKLIGSVILNGDETGPITVRLEPWGSVAGRIVDDDGRPRPGMTLQSTDGSIVKHPEDSDILPWTDWNGGVRLGNDGRFRVEGLVPGLKYNASAAEPFKLAGKLFVSVIVTAGEAKDLGDLKVIPALEADNP
jgi:RNA polymerase sigma factor (sigma-70 family)